MSFINYNAKEIHCKVVYYGPSLGGKTTNIQWVYQKTAEDQKSKLVALNTDIERTLFFDFLPLNVGEIRGFKTRFHLYTVPGQVVYDASRKLILKGLDGVIFVADSQIERMDENLESLRNLETNLEQQGYDIKEIPLIMQYNKRDLPNVASLAEMRSALNPYNAPEIEGCASEGRGVFESLKTASKSIINVLKGGTTL
ncbi:ADP-ribosylation factor-like protein [Bdellovibrio sp. SKB1291214]|jgi:signal recognition particle receptor subunit beta|uniref:GTPase MglA n=1 Tax=Bdellovibrio TaxID=958 RepID=UPI000B519B27|nr:MULTISPECIES: ADP-ribosylation factor-like protein [unclassified Bdellovibrio]QDK47121.1 gliding-motility protein MglA [Bdellovibrio sp. ZAP7]QLY25311.1 gliding-motility protein MglA [Bdellovibrio sp. KM01]UYL10727.1 ADP-ribosylation factor-like protein [Bdellovibrio sp. SKB1291214]